MKLNDFIQPREPITETIDSDKFKQILKIFLPIAKEIIQLDKMPTIILRKTIHDNEQPTMGRFNNETYSLELAIANRQPVDVLRTLAHELVHAKQDRNHVNIDPTTGSPEENQANEIAGIVMREFNKAHPNFLKLQPIEEGGNSELPNLDNPEQPHQAQHINLNKISRDDMLPAIDQLLATVNLEFQKATGKPLWGPGVLRDRKHLSGSTFHFLDPKIPTKEFVKYKPTVGDIDTMVDRVSKDEIEKFLQSIRNKPLGNFKLLNYDEESVAGKALRLKKGVGDKRAQFITQWEIFNPVQFKGLQIDLELSDYETNPGTGEEQPTDWARFSHSSAWEDITKNIKGVFHKWFIQSLTTISGSAKHRVDVLKTKTNIQPNTQDNNLSFAVASGQGGGMSQKYKSYTDPKTGDTHQNNIPYMQYVKPEHRTYEKGLDKQFLMLFGHKPTPADLQMYESFLGLIKLANQYLEPQQRQAVADDFVNSCFNLDAQMITKDNPEADAKVKMAAIVYMAKNLEGIDSEGIISKADKMVEAYAKDHYDLQAFKAANPDERQPRAAMRKAQMAAQQPIAEAIGEAGEDLAVKAQLRKGMPHLRDLKPADLLDLIDEIHDGNGNFKLQNIPLNVKVDGFGGRFGKDKSGKPFMGTSNTPPRYEAGFVKYHQQKGTTDPDVLGRAQLFDDLFEEMMQAISMVDNKLGKDFLINKQVTCEVLFLPFATQTPEGKLKFVGIHYDKLPDGVQLALVPFRVVDAESGEDLPDATEVIKKLTGIGRESSVMFINNSLTQNDALDVTAIVPPLENIEQIKAMLASGKLAQKREAKDILAPVAIALEKAIIEDPNIIGKDMLGKDYEGIVLNTRLGPVKVTSQEQRKVIADKLAAKKSAREERPRENTNKTAVVAIGSFVGHIGHEQLFDYTIKKAQQVGGDPYLFIGNAEGKADPIPPSVKVQTWHKMYPEYAKNISTVTQEGGSLMQKIKHELINPLPGKPPRYDNVIIMVGEDQAGMNIANALMKAVNKFQGYEHVKVSLEVTPRGTGMSFTKLRNILKDPNATPEQQYQTWAEGFDEKKLGKDWILHLMDLTRKGMGIKEPVPQQVAQSNKVKEPAVEGIGSMDTPLRRFMIKQIARITGRNDLDNQSDDEIENLFAKYVPGSEKKIEKFNHAMSEFSGLEYQDRMAGVGMGNYVVDETMLPKSAFAGSKKNKINGKGMKRGNDPTPVKAGDLVGEEAAGVGITTGYNTTKDVKPGTLNKEIKAYFPTKLPKAKNEAEGDANNCVKVGETWELEMANAVNKLLENFADGKKPGRKGLAKRSGVNTKASVSSLRNTAKHSTGEKARMAHWMANMKAGKAKK